MTPDSTLAVTETCPKDGVHLCSTGTENGSTRRGALTGGRDGRHAAGSPLLLLVEVPPPPLVQSLRRRDANRPARPEHLLRGLVERSVLFLDSGYSATTQLRAQWSFSMLLTLQRPSLPVVDQRP